MSSLIKQNTTELQTILDMVKNLPEAGSGGNAKPEVEPLTVTANGTYTPSSGVDGFNPVIVKVPTEGGTGGIIEVTELPTSGIDENAVYRLTETIQLEKTEVYLRVYLNGRDMTITLQQYIASLGVPTIANIYVVDELSNMLETDIQGFSVVNVYIKRSDGTAYVYSPYVPINNGIITIGYLAFTSQGHGEGYDKGFTENINAETDYGIYTTIENSNTVVRYFIRENGEWKEVTAHYEYTLPNGVNNIETVSGDISPIVYTASDLLDRSYTEIDENWFLKVDGTYINNIKDRVFSGSNNLVTATFPSFIDTIGSDIFTQCTNLTTITFKSKPVNISSVAFRDSYNWNGVTINVPWSESDPINENAPWGSPNATINYNCTEG